MAQQTVTLNPGESKAVSFEVTPTVAKTYQVSVDGLTGSFRAVVPSAQFVYVSAIRHYTQSVNVYPAGGGSTKYVVFEVDVQNQGGIAALCSAIASCRYTKGTSSTAPWSDYEPLRYEQYAGPNALALKVDSAYINPGEIVTFREATWKFAYESSHLIQVKFTGDAGEIIDAMLRIYMDQIWG